MTHDTDTSGDLGSADGTAGGMADGTVGAAASGAAARRDLPSDQTLGGIGIGIAIGFGLLVVYRLGDGQFGLPCPLLSLTGLNCPFCGGTRMASAFFSGDFGAALTYNAPALVLCAALAYLWVTWLLQRFTGFALPRPRWGPVGRRRLFVAVLAVLLAFTVIRNLPWPPFTALYV